MIGRPHRFSARPRAIAWCLLLLGATTGTEVRAVSGGASPAPEALLGRWAATLEHAGQAASMALEISAADGGGAPVGRLSLPAIDLWDLAVGRLVVAEDSVRVGPFEMRWSAEDQTLRGVLPTAFVPVVSIPFELRREVAPTARAADAAAAGALATPVWRFRVDAPVWAALALSGDTLLVGDDAGIVTALSAADGSPRWRFATGGSIRARPTVVGEIALIHSDDGVLYAVELDAGRERWRRRLGPASTRKPLDDPASRYEHFSSAATVAGDRVYVANAAGELLCLDGADGAPVWRFAADDSITSTPAVAHGRVFVGSFDHHVHAVDAATGEALWRRDTGAAVAASPVVIGDLVLVGGRSYDFLALEAATGAPVWSRYFWFSWVEATAAGPDREVYVGLSDGQKLWALDAGAGRERWSFDTGGSIWAAPAVTGPTVYVAAVGVPGYIVDHRGGLFAVDRASGRELWRYPVPVDLTAPASGFGAAPAAGAGRVFAATLAGEVLAFEAPAR